MLKLVLKYAPAVLVNISPTIKSVARKLGLQTTEAFVSSTLQLYETVQVRHGLMVVGQAYAGKTSCIRVLKGAMTEITRHFNVWTCW